MRRSQSFYDSVRIVPRLAVLSRSSNLDEKNAGQLEFMSVSELIASASTVVSEKL